VRDTLVFLRFDMRTQRRDTVARLPGASRFVPAYWQAIVGATGRSDGPPPPPPPPPPFSPRPVTLASGNRFYYGSGDDSEVAVYDASSGALTMLLRAALPRRAVTRVLVNSLRSEMSERMPATPLRAGYLRLIDQSPTPDSLPAYDRMLIDRDGALWLREYRAPADVSVAWNVFDRPGRWLARVDLPAQLDVRDIGADYLIAITRDSLDVELVQLYRLTRPSAALSR
jgi:hypothetical protein